MIINALLFILLSISAYAAEPVIAHLTAPSLDNDRITVASYCDRPRRSEGVNISLEQRDEKTILLHCYGHGGFGYTTLFGSIEEALGLLSTKNISHDTPIRIIGSGCMGLLMAIELHRQGFNSITISTKEKYNIPSWRAGGFFDPGVGTETDPADIHHLKLGLTTFTALQSIEQGNHPYLPSTIVQQMPIYYPTSLNVGVEILEKLQLMPPSERVTLDFGNGTTHTDYKRQMTYFIDVTRLMQCLWQQVNARGISVKEETVSSFADCQESVIVNCTGLGSNTINNDARVNPARGHFLMISKDPQEKPLPYMLFTKVGEQKKWVYFFPKPAFVNEQGHYQETQGMIGGTYIPCNNIDPISLRQLDEDELRTMTTRARNFFYGAAQPATA